MKVKIESSRIIKPSYEGSPFSPTITQQVPLSIFDKVAYGSHIAVIYGYRAPTPPNAILIQGLKRVLSLYREWAGRLGKNEKGERVIFLNDQGVRLVEASVDNRLDQAMPLKPSPNLLSLHPSLRDVEELVQVQLTRFACGSLVIGFTSHHLVADGHATCNFLIAWGKACRGIDIDPIPLHYRNIFIPRNPPKFEFEHKGVEYMNKKLLKLEDNHINDILVGEIVVHKVHFSMEFLAKLKAKCYLESYAQSNFTKSYSTFVCLVAHLWRTITRVRGLNGYETTQVRISVNGRMRLNPRVPNNYFGNLVLWAFPRAKIKDLLREPLSYAAEVISNAISRVNDDYFRSFIDYATYKVRDDQENVIPTADLDYPILCPNIEIDSWLRLPFYDLDFGCGSPYMFMPTYYPTEGMLFLVPSFLGDGSVDAYIPLLKENMDCFKQHCYSLD